jgi:hypothetical protein
LLLFTSRPILAVNGGLCWFCNFPKEILFRKPPVVVLGSSGGWCSRHEKSGWSGKSLQVLRPAPRLLLMHHQSCPLTRTTENKKIPSQLSQCSPTKPPRKILTPTMATARKNPPRPPLQTLIHRRRHPPPPIQTTPLP